MRVRTITSAIILAVAIPLLIFSKYLVYPIALALLSLGAIFEMLRVMGMHKTWVISIPAYMMSVVFPLSSYYITHETRSFYLLVTAAVTFAYLIYIMCVAVFSKGSISVSKISEVFLVFTYINTSFTSLCLIRYIEHGLLCLCLVFITAWVSDSMAYIVGSLIGRHKLIPEISPKKTVEGAVGGILSAALGSALFGLIVNLTSGINPNYLVLVISGLILSVVSQIGDLIASLIKREHGVKDYGKLLPGHGGIMDRFDSVLAVATPLLVICMVFHPFL